MESPICKNHQYSPTYYININVRVSEGLSVFSFGIHKNDLISDRKEIFAEAIFLPSDFLETKISYFREIDDIESNYLEVLIRRPWVSKNGLWFAKPYMLLSAGDYHSPDLSLNHFEIGSDFTYRIDSNLFLGANASVISPLEGVSDAYPDSSDELNFGIFARYSF